MPTQKVMHGNVCSASEIHIETGGGGGGNPIDVWENGIPVVTGVTVINFLGAGVSVVAVGTRADVTIAGGGGGGPHLPQFSVQYNDPIGFFNGDAGFLFNDLGDESVFLHSTALTAIRIRGNANDSIQVGVGATTGATAVSIGAGAVTSGNSAVAVGNVVTSGNDGVGIGHTVNAGVSAVAIGLSSTAQNSAVAIGKSSTATTEAVAIGDTATAHANCVAIGITSSALGANSVAVGQAATANGGNNVAVGVGSTTTGTAVIAIGSSATASVADAIAIGDTANASAQNAIAIGVIARATGTSAVAIGSNAVSDNNGVAVGANSSVGFSTGVAVGLGATVVSGNGVAIGPGSQAKVTGVSVGASAFGTSANGSTLLGNQTSDGGFLGTAVGRLSTLTAAGQFVGGSLVNPISAVYFGNGVSAAFPPNPVAYQIFGTGAIGLDRSGADIGVVGGISTGTADGGAFGVYHSFASGSSSTPNAVTKIAEFSSNIFIGLGGSVSTTTPKINVDATQIYLGPQTGDSFEAVFAQNGIMALFTNLNDVTVANTLTTTSLFDPAGQSSTTAVLATIPLNYFDSHKTLNIKAKGEVGQIVGTVATIQLLKGATVIGNAGPLAFVLGGVGTLGQLDIDIMVTGRAAGTVVTTGNILSVFNGNVFRQNVMVSGGTFPASAVAINAAAETIDLQITWSVADPGNSLTISNLNLTVVD